MPGLDLVTPSGVDLVALDVLKAHLHVDAPDEDTLIAVYAAAARTAAETFLKCSLLEATWRYRIDNGFPWEIRLPIGPLLTVTGLDIKYSDDAGVEQTLAPAMYRVSLGDTGVVRPAWGQVWPSTRPELDAVRVSFRAGWPDAGNVPKAIVAAVLLTTGHLFENREASIIGESAAELPLGVKNLLMPFVRSG